MNDEIKEILDNTLEYLKRIDETRNTKILTTNEANILLNYITNLEQGNKRLYNIINTIELCLIASGVDDKILECCDNYDVNGVFLRKRIKELRGENEKYNQDND